MKSFELLRAQLMRKQKKNKTFSLRNLAQRLEVSPAFLSKVLNGKKQLPPSRLADFSEALGFDSIGRRRLERAVLNEQKMDWVSQAERAPSPAETYEETAPGSALEEWYYLPILELVTLAGFEPAWIEERLGLKKEIAARAWSRLQELGWVKESAGQWQKRAKKIRFPSHQLDPQIQRHHTSMLKKAIDEMQYRKTSEDFARRLILGASVATNEESFKRAQKYLEEALFHAGDILASGKADRVYYLAFQLFPVSLQGNRK